MGGRWPTADFRESRSFQRLQSSNFRPTRIGRTPFRNFQSFRIALSRVSLGSTDDRVMADCCSTRMHRFVLCFVICRGQPDHGARAGWETTSSQPVMGDFGSIINTAQELVQHRRRAASQPEHVTARPPAVLPQSLGPLTLPAWTFVNRQAVSLCRESCFAWP